MEFDDVDSLPPPVRPRPVRTRLVRLRNGRVDTPEPHRIKERASDGDIAMQPTISLENAVSLHKKSVTTSQSNGIHKKVSAHLFDEDISKQSTVHLMQLSGMMPAIQIPNLGSAENSQGPK